MFSVVRQAFARLHPHWFICAGKITWTDGAQSVTFLPETCRAESRIPTLGTSVRMRTANDLKI